MYGKLFASIYDGTLYGHWQAIVTFQQMIILCDADGILDMTPQALAARTSIPLEIIVEGIKQLEKADPHSRTPGEDGKRLELMDTHRPWGWRIINHRHYRQLVSAQDRREYQKRYYETVTKPARSGLPTDVKTCQQSSTDSSHTDTDTDTEIETPPKAATSRRKRAAKTAIPDDFSLDPEMAEYAAARLPGVDAAQFFESFRGKALAKGWKYANWRQAFRDHVRSAAPGSGHWSEGQYPKAGGGIKWR